MTTQKKSQGQGGTDNHLHNKVYPTPSLVEAVQDLQNRIYSMLATGIPNIKADGVIHRFRLHQDKKGKVSGWYVMFSNPFSGAFGSWVSGETHQFMYKTDKPLSTEERQAISKQIQKSKAQRQAKEEKKNREGAKRALYIWQKQTRPLTRDHGYVTKKHLNHLGGLRLYAGNNSRYKDCIVVPLYYRKSIVSLQFINPEKDKQTNRDKTFLNGASVKNDFFMYGNIIAPMKILICEGIATGDSLYSVFPDALVLCSLSSHNMVNVGLDARRAFTDSVPIVFCADHDPKEDGSNPGVDSARRASKQVKNSSVSIPTLPDGSGKKVDFNDLWVLSVEDSNHE